MTPKTILTERMQVHGHEVAFLQGGSGDPLLFLHGIAGSCTTFDLVLPEIAKHHRVIAPDLLGHGRSAKPRGDYSLGAHASGLRDLLELLEIPAVTIVGHSLGGGVALQFAYQFPERCERLVLVDSGGLGPEVSSILRAATLPGTDLVLSVATSDRMKRFAAAARSRAAKLGFKGPDSIDHIAQHLACLQDKETRRAFVQTARSVLDLRGQRVDARDRLYLAEAVPTMIVWGERDRFIPARHGEEAHRLMPGSRLEIFEGAGHFPHRDDPERFTQVLLDFIRSTTPARVTADKLRTLARDRSAPNGTMVDAPAST